MKPYRPSNGTEGEGFIECNCGECSYYQVSVGDEARGCDIPGCPIVDATFWAEIGKPEYPNQWVTDDDGKNARCLAYSKLVKVGAAALDDHLKRRRR